VAVPDIVLPDQSGEPWAMRDALREGALALVFYRGDWCAYCNGQLVALAERHAELLEAGTRVVGVVVDPPERNAAMIAKLRLPFPILSDPDGGVAIRPLDVWDDEGGHARPATVLVAPDGTKAWYQVGRDLADRAMESELVDAARALGLPPAPALEVRRGRARPGDEAFPITAFAPYFRGVTFAAQALADRVPAVAEEAGRLQDEARRYAEAAAARLR
jgi:peroxiredoxin